MEHQKYWFYGSIYKKKVKLRANSTKNYKTRELLIIVSKTSLNYLKIIGNRFLIN